MTSDGEPNSEESQFVYQSGDDENLWEIVGILGEKGGQYKVKWAGIDPKTNKPWGNSWVKRSDVTPDVAQEWKEKQASKRRRKSGKSSKTPRTSAVSDRTATTSTVRRDRSDAAAPAVKSESASPSPPRSPTPPGFSASPAQVNGKRKYPATALDDSDSDLPDPLTVLSRGKEPQKKRRKISSEPVLNGKETKARVSNVKGKAREEEEEPDDEHKSEEDDLLPRGSKAKVQPGRKKQNSKLSTSKSIIPKHRREAQDEEDERPSRRSNGASSSTSKVSANGRKKPESTTINGRPSKASTARSPSVISISDGEEDLPKRPVAARKSGGSTKEQPQSKTETSHKTKTDEERVSETEDDAPRAPSSTTSDLSPSVQQRLEEFDKSLYRIDHPEEEQTEHTSESEPSHSAFVYAEEDVESVAGVLMYPQEDGQPSPSRTKTKKVPRPPPTTPPPNPTSRSLVATPSRSSLISQMKPRTPRPALDMDVDKTSKAKVLRPIPQISPSIFRPHLPNSSTAINSFIEEEEETEIEEPMSSIEQFDSPDKKKASTQRRAVVAMATKSKGKQKETSDYVMRRGQEIAEKARKDKEKAKKSAGYGPPRKQTLAEVQTRHRSSSSSKAFETESSPPTSPPPPEEDDAPPSKPTHTQEDEDEDIDLGGDFYVDDITMNEDDTYMEDDGEIPPGVRVFLPEEEEESTQDLLQQEVEQVSQLLEGLRSPTPRREAASSQPAELPNPGSRSPSPQQQGEEAPALAQDAPPQEEGDEEEAADISMEPQPGTMPPKGGEVVDKEEEEGEEQEQEDEERVQEEEESPQEGTQEIPPTASTRTEELSQESNQTNMSIDSTGQKEHIGYMTLLNAKSEEIVNLGKQLEEERSRNEEFTNRIAVLEAQLQAAQNSALVEKERADQLQLKSEESSTQLAEVSSKFEAAGGDWKIQVKTLTAEVEKQKEQVRVTEQHKQDIARLYGMETGTTSQLRKDKKELSKELEIARGQAVEGVKGVRLMLEKNLEEIKQDRDRWRKMAEFALAKDAKMNDNLRFNAAETPELRRKCRNYKSQIANLRSDAENYVRDIKEKDDMLYVMEGEIDRLSKELDELTPGRPVLPPNGHGRSPMPSPRPDAPTSDQEPEQSPAQLEPEEDQEDPEVDAEAEAEAEYSTESEDEDPEQEVWRCQWRLDNDKFCNRLFDTKDGLEDHIFSSGHVERHQSPIDALD